MKKPDSSEYAPYYQSYVNLVEDDLMDALLINHEATQDLMESITEVKSDYRYEAGKWSIKEVFLHLMDTERIFNYRALMFARGFDKELSGYDHDAFVKNSFGEEHSLSAIAEEFLMVRNATISLFGNLDDSVLDNKGVANGNEQTVRSIAYIIAGHELHHVNIIRERYLS